MRFGSLNGAGEREGQRRAGKKRGRLEMVLDGMERKGKGDGTVEKDKKRKE